MPRHEEPDPVEWVRERWEAQALPQPERFAAAASLMRAHQLVAAEMDRVLRPHGIGRTTYFALATLELAPDGARPLAYLSRYLLVHPTTVTQMIDQCERQGWVQRSPHPSDRRSSLAVLRPAGRKLLAGATKALADAGFGLGAIAADDVVGLSSGLREVRRALGDLPASAHDPA